MRSWKKTPNNNINPLFQNNNSGADDDPRPVVRPWNAALAARNVMLIKNPVTPPISPKINMGLRFHPFYLLLIASITPTMTAIATTTPMMA